MPWKPHYIDHSTTQDYLYRVESHISDEWKDLHKQPKVTILEHLTLQQLEWWMHLLLGWEWRVGYEALWPIVITAQVKKSRKPHRKTETYKCSYIIYQEYSLE